MVFPWIEIETGILLYLFVCLSERTRAADTQSDGQDKLQRAEI